MGSFVGRSAELERLGRRLEAALAGRGGAVFVTGEAGAGKSALVEEFLARAAEHAPPVRAIRAACSEQFGAGEPYQPFVDAARELLTEPPPAAAGRRSLREVASELAPYWISAIPVAGSFIAATLATATELRRTLGGTGVGATAAPPSEEALFFQYTELFLAAAAATPIVLLIDDLHWADRASVALLGHLARKVAGQPVLLLGTYRPADVEATGHPVRAVRLELERYGLAEELALEPLDPAALGALVAAELGGPAAPDLVAWLVRRAGTNPLFLGELLRWLVERGIAREHRGEWVLARVPEEIEVPRSAESAIEARLARLEAEPYRLLEYASVAGTEFDSTTLAQLLDADELAVEEGLEPLARVHRLVRLTETRVLPSGEPASVYEFAHSLVHDVVDRRLQGKRRILLHRKMAGILEQLYAAEPDAIAHRLAVHYDEGRLAERAYEAALRAADRASRVYAHLDALELVRRALRNAQTEAQRAAALERLGESSARTGRYADALAAYGDALAAAGAAGEAARALVVRRKALLVEKYLGSRPAREIVDQLMELGQAARALGERAELCRILWYAAGMPGTGVVEGLARAREALEVAASVGDPELLAAAHFNVGKALQLAGDPRGALSAYGEALALYERLEDRQRVGMCHNSLAVIQVYLGDPRAAAAEFETAAALFHAAGDPAAEAMVRSNHGALLSRLGEFERAERSLREALRIDERIDALARSLHPLQNLAELAQLRGDRAAERGWWERLLERARATGYRLEEALAHSGLGHVALEEGDLAEARARLATAAALLAEEDGGWSEAREAHHFLAARVAAAEGDAARAIAVLEAAERELGDRDRYTWARARLSKAEAAAAADPARAAAWAREAREALAALGARPLACRADQLLRALGEEP